MRYTSWCAVFALFSVPVGLLWIRLDRAQERIADVEADLENSREAGVATASEGPGAFPGPRLEMVERHDRSVDLAGRVERLVARIDALEEVERSGPSDAALAAAVRRLIEWASSDGLHEPPMGGASESGDRPGRSPRHASRMAPIGFSEFSARFQLTDTQQQAIAPLVAETESELRALYSTEDLQGRTWATLSDITPDSEAASDAVARFESAYKRLKEFGNQLMPGCSVTFSQQENVIRARGATRVYRELTDAQRRLWDEFRSASMSLFIAPR